MEISNSRIKEFIALYRAEFSVVLEEKEALEAGIALTNLVKAVYCRDELPTYNEPYEDISGSE